MRWNVKQTTQRRRSHNLPENGALRQCATATIQLILVNAHFFLFLRASRISRVLASDLASFDAPQAPCHGFWNQLVLGDFCSANDLIPVSVSQEMNI
jgi:hypothetical protein